MRILVTVIEIVSLCV